MILGFLEQCLPLLPSATRRWSGKRCPFLYGTTPRTNCYGYCVRIEFARIAICNLAGSPGNCVTARRSRSSTSRSLCVRILHHTRLTLSEHFCRIVSDVVSTKCISDIRNIAVERRQNTRFVGCAGIEHIVKGGHWAKNSAQCASECAFYSHSRARQQSLGVALSRLNRRSTVPSGFCFESVGKSKLCGKPAWVRVRRGRGPKPIGQKFGVIAKGRSSGIENAVR